VRETLAQAEIEAIAPDGTTYKYKGLEISYGIGPNLKEADNAMAASKREREERGLRAPRGERPKGMAAIPAPGVETEGKTPGGEVEEPKKLPANWIEAGWKIEQRGVLQTAISPKARNIPSGGSGLNLSKNLPRRPSPRPNPKKKKPDRARNGKRLSASDSGISPPWARWKGSIPGRKLRPYQDGRQKKARKRQSKKLEK